MAVKGSGTVARANNPDPAMVDQTKYDARSGAAKHAQTSFPTKWGMTDQTKMSGLGPGIGGPNGAPDASSPNPLDPEPRVKNLRRQPVKMEAKWGMKGASQTDGMSDSHVTGKTLETPMPDGTKLGAEAMAGKVLGEAILSGSSKLPASASSKTDSGARPNAWPAQDRG